MSEPHATWSADDLGHGLRPMSGRDPEAHERAATPLELLFDLVFVVAFGQAGNEFAHLVAEGQWGIGLYGFAFAMFAIVWAWINYTWFASAYDTDDWAHRVVTMVVMVGALVVAVGIPPLFTSLAEQATLDNGVIVAGYVVMRLAMVSLWVRAARQDPTRARTARVYVVTIVVAQVGWCVTPFLDLSPAGFLAIGLPLYLLEMGGPWWAETRAGGTPWHAGHVAERYGLLTIIALGEVILGTVAALNVLVAAEGWSVESVTIAVAGIGLTFGLWWTYFAIPSGELLRRRRSLSIGWGYGHVGLYMAIAAVGAGLHVAALVAEDVLATEHGGEAHHAIGVPGAIWSIAIPLAVYLVVLYGGYAWMVGTFDRFHRVPLGASLVLVAGSVGLAVAGASLSVCLLVLMLVPVATVVSFETRGRRHVTTRLAELAD